MDITYVEAKNIVTAARGGDNWFGMDYNMNIYRGCSHGCVYCDSRSECYGDDDFETVKVKRNAIGKILDDLRRKRRTGVVATGAMSDPYNPLERDLRLTRQAMELLATYGFGAAIATKSPLITRDIDVLTGIAKHSPVICKLTVTCADDELSRVLEPRAAPSSERFAALRRLSDSGLFAGVLLMPVLPYISDSDENVLGVVRSAAEAGARFIYPWFGVTTRDRQRAYLYDRFDESFPGVRELYLARFGNNYSCASPRSKRLRELFTRECKKLGILYAMPDIIAAYKRGFEQYSLFT